MRVLVLTQHFAPEVTAGRFRVEGFAHGLRDRGHDVSVICPAPNHPRGEFDPGYAQRLVDRRDLDGVEVAYLRVAVSPRKTLRTRLAYYGSYAALATTAGAAFRRPDLILASSPPLTVATAGRMLAVRHRVPLLLDIRDLWPDSAVDLGEIEPDGRAAKLIRSLERRAYAKAAAIVTANDAFRKRIVARAPAGARVETIPNGTSPTWLEAGQAEVDRADVGLPRDGFVWAYAGNIGLAHGLEHAADASALLGSDFHLLVIGEGPRRHDLELRVAKADTVDLRGLMAPEEAARHLRAADALLVSERQEETVSAKLYDVCALGRPVVAACRGELRRLIEAEGIGYTVPHGDPAALADAVRRVRSEPEAARAVAARALAFARAHMRATQARRLAELAEDLESR